MNGRLISVSSAELELDLGFLRRFSQPLQRHPVMRQVHARFLLELADQPVHQPLVDVVAAQVRIPVGQLHLHHAVTHLQNRYVERAAAEIVDRDPLFLLLVQPVGQRRRGRLVDDPHHLQARHVPRVLRRLALGVVEIRRHGDHGARHFLAQVGLGSLLQLGQNHRRNFRRGVLLALRLHARIAAVAAHDMVRHQLHLFGHFVKPPAHEALDRIHRVFRIRHRLALRHLAHQSVAGLGKTHHRGRRPPTLLVWNDYGLPALNDRYHRVGGAEVDADDLVHVDLSLGWSQEVAETEIAAAIAAARSTRVHGATALDLSMLLE